MQLALNVLLRQAQQALATDPGHAAGLARQVLARQRRNTTALHLLAMAQVAQGSFADAAATYRQLIALRRGDAALHVELGRVHYTLGDIDTAIDVAGRAVHLDRRCPGALANWLGMRLQRGEFDTALPELAAAFDANARDREIAMAFGEFAIRLGRVPEAIDRLRAHLPGAAADPVDQGIMLHRLALLCEHERRYEEAFAAARAAKALCTGRWDADGYDRYVDRIIATFSREFLANAPRRQASSERPVFIVGMFRSGTSLTEQILASHSRVFGAGELPWLRELLAPLLRTVRADGPGAAQRMVTQQEVDRVGSAYLARLESLAADAARITDKHPVNVEALGAIQLALPGAKVIYCVRDPMDTCVSAFFTNFSPGYEFATDLTSLGRYFRAYERLMAHWRSVLDLPILELRYEELVSDTDAQIRRVVDFTGLAWEDSCLQFHDARRTTLTPSNQQVRRPMYRESIGRHVPYLRHLDELQRALGQSPATAR